MAEWADKAVCYRWMHEKTERIFKTKDMGFMFPVIILSTVTGAANFALDSVLTDPDHKKYAQLALGGLSIATGIISTIANRLGYASGAEAHKGAAIQWGKLNSVSTPMNAPIVCSSSKCVVRTWTVSLNRALPSPIP